MATTTAQRTGIWIIAIVLTIGTIAGFVAMIIAPSNQTADEQRLNTIYAKYQKDYTAYQKATEAQQSDLEKRQAILSAKYYVVLKGYSDKYVGTFDKATAQKKLTVQELSKGSGVVIGDNTTYAAYYIGWTPDGKVFDGTLDGAKLKTPFIVRPGGVIKGWDEGTKGMKIGGARLITIPSEQAYGSQEKENIPADTPLRFIVLPIETLQTIIEPEIPEELLTGAGY